MRPLLFPNLPQADVGLCVMQDCPGADVLRARGVQVLHPAACVTLPEETASHADMLLCHTGGAAVFAEPSQMFLAAALLALGFDVRFSAAAGDVYPLDVPLNVAVGRSFAAGNFDQTDPSLLLALRISGRRLLKTKQGYAKCALCFVRDNAFITEDAGMAAVLSAAGMDVCLIAAGDVRLSHRHHGFFGGAAGLIAPDVLAVNGELKRHRDDRKIIGFLKKYGVTPLELAQGDIQDIGGILPLMEGKQ